MKVFKVKQLVSINGWGATEYKTVSPLFTTKEKAITWMKEHYSEKEYTFNGYCTEVVVFSEEIIS